MLDSIADNARVAGDFLLTRFPHPTGEEFLSELLEVLNVLELTVHDCLPSNSVELDDFFHDQEKVPGLAITAFEPLLYWDGILRV